MSSYLLKITLRETPNLVWRRFVVPSFTTLNRLHEVIQDVMGWQRKETHVFYFRKQGYVPTTVRRRSRSEIAEVSVRDDFLPEEMFSLDDLVLQSGTKLKYYYDPDGARWVHDISVENIRYLNEAWPFPIFCLEGVRACPPESCGGAPGFIEMLKALKDTGHPRHEEFVSQFGSFDPDRFSLEKINRLFKVKGPVDGKPSDAKERTILPARTEDALHLLGRKLKKKAAS